MQNTFAEAARRHFELSFQMLEELIAICPEELWNRKLGGFVFWQQLLHALSGVDYWMRDAEGPFIEPFSERKLHPELDAEPEGGLTREELEAYKDKVRLACSAYFNGKDDAWLLSCSAIYDKISNQDIVYMLMRHIQYHVGHCDGLLRDRGGKTAEWVDYFGE